MTTLAALMNTLVDRRALAVSAASLADQLIWLVAGRWFCDHPEHARK